ncbi:RNA ligase/cyclic nucleotide phosphodiesterase [Trichoderma barbatum]
MPSYSSSFCPACPLSPALEETAIPSNTVYHPYMHFQLRYIIAVCIYGISLLLIRRSYSTKYFAPMAPNSNTVTETSAPKPQESIHAGPAKWTGKKFDANGNVLPFPGNTIICHLSQESEMHKALMPIFEMLQKSRFMKFYTLLPQSSWHMTVFEGVADQRRKREVWPKPLSLDAPLEKCHDLFGERLSKFNLGIQVPIHMSVSGLVMSQGGIRLDLAPIDAAEEKRLRGLRDRLSELLEIRARGHNTYVFHLALAYRFIPVSQEDEDGLSKLLEEGYKAIPHEFELGVPEFCYFDDMYVFHRQFFLKDQSRDLA